MRTSKKLFCIVSVILTLLLDTSLIPYAGLNTSYCPRLCLIAVIMIGCLAGRTQGIIYGTLAGLMLGFTVYTPASFTLIIYVLCGLIAGFWGHIVPRLLITVVPVFASLFVYEGINAIYFYFSGGTLPLFMVMNAGIRIVTGLVAAQLLYFPFYRVLVHKRRKAGGQAA